MTKPLLLSELTRDFVGNRSSHPKVIVPEIFSQVARNSNKECM